MGNSLPANNVECSTSTHSRRRRISGLERQLSLNGGKLNLLRGRQVTRKEMEGTYVSLQENGFIQLSTSAYRTLIIRIHQSQ